MSENQSSKRFPVATSICACAAVLAVLVGRAEGAQNYAEALQKSLFFYETQISGRVPPEHRAEWRGDSCMRDGSDVGRDLTGGWYDAGDGVVWTANDCFGATMLAWSLVNYRDVYRQTAQYRIALDRLREIDAYLVKIVQTNAAGAIERIYCGKGTTENRPPLDPAPDNDRTEGCPNEVIDTPVGGAPQSLRPSYWVDDTVGGADVAGAVAATMACVSIVFRDAGDANGADTRLALARTLYNWGDTHRNANTKTRRLTNGTPVTINTYEIRNSNYRPFLISAAAWLHRAELAAGTPGYANAWVDKAEALYNESGNSGNRHKHWDTFEPGAQQNGAYALLAAASGRPAFVAEANAYADFWLYSRTLVTDPNTSPAGFISRSQGGGWNINKLMDQAPPLLEWADSPYNADATRRANLVALYTGTYTHNGQTNLCPVRQIDYVLGDNPYNLSYVMGYAPPGKTWVTNYHHRALRFLYGGFGTPLPDAPAWNTATAWGLLAPGPDKNDYFPKAVPLTNTVDYAYQEPIVYSGGILTVLARNVRAGGPNADRPLAVFPPWVARPPDYQTRSFFVAAYAQSATRLQCFINNRASLPPRETGALGFRYYFTPDGVNGTQVVCAATGSGLLAGESVSVAGPFPCGATTDWYFEIRFDNACIVPGEYNRCRRQVQLDFSQPAGTFTRTNDHSGAAISGSQAMIANLPVYDTSGGTWRLLGGFEPSAGCVQFRRAHFNNTWENAGAVQVLVERVGGAGGAVSAILACSNGTARAGADFHAPAGAAAQVSWAAGETGEKTLAIPLVDDRRDRGRRYFFVSLTDLTGGLRGGLTPAARVSIEDDDAGVAGTHLSIALFTNEAR